MAESSRHFNQDELFAHIDEAIADNEIVMRGLYTVAQEATSETTGNPGEIGSVEVVGYRAE